MAIIIIIIIISLSYLKVFPQLFFFAGLLSLSWVIEPELGY